MARQRAATLLLRAANYAASRRSVAPIQPWLLAVGGLQQRTPASLPTCVGKGLAAAGVSAVAGAGHQAGCRPQDVCFRGAARDPCSGTSVKEYSRRPETLHMHTTHAGHPMAVSNLSAERCTPPPAQWSPAAALQTGRGRGRLPG